VYFSAGTSCPDGVSEPCMPVSADSRGSALQERSPGSRLHAPR
jgi:hypothetical protein